MYRMQEINKEIDCIVCYSNVAIPWDDCEAMEKVITLELYRVFPWTATIPYN